MATIALREPFVPRGSHCLEAAQAGGSIVNWMDDRVGLDVCVDAVDLRTDYLEPCRPMYVSSPETWRKPKSLMAMPLLQAVVGADGARGTQLPAMSDKEHDLPLPSAEILWKSSG